MAIYAKQLRDALAAAFDPAALAAAWIALHPKGTGSVSRPALAQFLSRAREAITAALKRVLDRLWPEAWVLGEKSAEALTAGLETPDWGTWKPGDYEAAQEIAGPGLRQLLAEAGIRIKSIADSRLEELSAVLEQTLASDEVTREMDQPKPVTLSVQSLADQLRDVLDNPGRAELVAQTEIARAQSSAALREYAESAVERVEWSTAEDAKVCPRCDADEAAGPVPIHTAFPSGNLMPPGHPRCRCALIPAALPALAGVS
jgi:SPP1 gp7 family putative phage head morphogenesis protein